MCVCVYVCVCIMETFTVCSLSTFQVRVHAKSLRPIWLLATLMDFSPPGSSVDGFSRQEYGVDCHFLLQGIFKSQGSNLCLLCLLYWQADSPLAPPGMEYSIVNSRHHAARDMPRAYSSYNRSSYPWRLIPQLPLGPGKVADF